VDDVIELKLKVLLARIMHVDVAAITASSSSETIVTWDSLNHMKLVLALEEEFHLVFDENQIENMTSFAKVIELIRQLKT
jgi:acyl carrier protein